MTQTEKLKDIKEHPDKHRHRDFAELTRCCSVVVDGVIGLDLVLMDAHEGLMGRNGGRGCDVERGPCSCGAWH